MKRGDSKTITVDGVQIEAEYLGKGHYATAYQAGETVYLFVKEEETMKELLTHCEGLHIPAITTHDTQYNPRNGEDVQVYSMPYYRNITAADQDAWADYRLMQKLFAQAREEISKTKSYYQPQCHYAYQINDRFVELLQEFGARESLISSIDIVNSWARNYGAGVTWEWGTRNIGVDQDGNIILRDCLFDSEKLYNEIMKKRRQYGYR